TDCVVYGSNPCFDASTFEVWSALLNGASVLVVRQDILLEPKRFAETLLSHNATVLWLTVGLFARYVDVLADVFPRLRYLLTGGDVVNPRTACRALSYNPSLLLLNGYGPTECTTFSTIYEIRSTAAKMESVPIGKP